MKLITYYAALIIMIITLLAYVMHFVNLL